jgi:thiamine-phosphate pyrophosphorylase
MGSEPGCKLPMPRFYPVLPDIGWLEQVVPLGIKVVQLRLKGVSAAEVERQIKAAIALCKKHDCQLVVNDYWRQAINSGADFVHLGQEDLDHADLAAIKGAGLKLGISTHDHAELASAMAAKPDYVALGPIWPTKLKKMRWKPQGLDRLREWKKIIAPLPLVAIGGITPDRMPQVMDAGADCAAVVTDIITAEDVPGKISQWLSSSLV